MDKLTFERYIFYYQSLLEVNNEFKLLVQYGENLIKNLLSYTNCHHQNTMLAFTEIVALDAKLQLLDCYCSYMKDLKLQMSEKEIIDLIETEYKKFYIESLNWDIESNHRTPFSLLVIA
ncbi:hypothetical protein A5844_000920 [Enterococcus sp. 10A9_DIV0425]|uniref:Uncharacterized protein n=1 Tax=Candidatus Enterococcus wittei TaxID=1987383 RepID=A0A242K161_9ENTE|nr:hypothetical protein [Enterococcus sp. 10A9_DIV0425]OTP10786.1 hypothetical protein A5844_000920 [Enterococcus sp. 10A9_DIV0425]THE10789.1 hypothetical protein E1H99_09250 [Enterococcus hirae]